MRKKKIVDKLTEKIETPSFSKISNRINYDEYIKEKRKPRKRLVFLFSSLGVVCAIALVFLIDLINVKSYNAQIDKFNKEYYSNTQLEMKQVYSKDEVNLINRKYINTIGERIINSLSTIGGLKNETISSSSIYETGTSEGMTPGNNVPSDSFETNEQVEGIEEADVSKCDGKYIYTLNNESLKIYGLSGNVIGTNRDITLKDYCSMYVHGDDIIVIGDKKTTILQFADCNMEVKNTFEYSSYSDSRVKGDYLYLISILGNLDDEDRIKCAYYDGYTYVDKVYSIVKYNLNDYSYEETKNLNRGTANLYFSENHIYLATNVFVPTEYMGVAPARYISILSIFDLDLKPLAALRMKGSVLNQFSMDEYDGYIRVVTTNTSAIENHLNIISIYDLSTLKLVGQLDEGIGIGRQTVKSVRFNKNTCYIVTYENKDPLYELDLSDVTAPRIVSSYAAPGYSTYLHNFKVGEENYLFGLGLLDDQSSIKVSVYKDDEETTQIGSDFVFSKYYAFDFSTDIIIDYFDMNYRVLYDHKALFIMQDGDDLYLGMGVSTSEYFILKISVKEENVVSLYKRVSLDANFAYSRCYFIDGKFYITSDGFLKIENFQ